MLYPRPSSKRFTYYYPLAHLYTLTPQLLNGAYNIKATVGGPRLYRVMMSIDFSYMYLLIQFEING